MSDRRIIEQVDVETGEVLRGCMMLIPYRPKHIERFFMAFQDGLLEIAKDSDITGADMRVLMYLFGHLDFENFIHVSQQEIAEYVGMQAPNISRSMKLLIRKGIILDGPKIGRMKTYRLSPDLGWKGKVTSLNEYRRSQLKVLQGGKPDVA
jgi:CRP-like cAMP-binding protein